MVYCQEVPEYRTNKFRSTRVFPPASGAFHAIPASEIYTTEYLTARGEDFDADKSIMVANIEEEET